jgi:hypothetical protein
MRSGSRFTVALAARAEDCLSCDLQGVFVAIRALQREGTGENGPEVVLLAVSRDSSDTLLFRRTLRTERVAGRIVRIPPRDAREFVSDDRLPAMYLIKKGRIVWEWERDPEHGPVWIERFDLLDAVSKTDAQ